MDFNADGTVWYGGMVWKKISVIFGKRVATWTTSVVEWSAFLVANLEVPGLIPGATRFSK
jgi:hypothetical protein